MIVAALLALQAPAQDIPSGGPLISQMLARYAAAQTVQGTIITTQSARGVKVTTRTEIAIEKPAKVRIAQTRDGSQGGTWLVVSDGRMVGYPRPKGVFGKERFTDPVQGGLEDIYTAVQNSLGEKSVPLNIVMGRKGDLMAFVGMLTPTKLGDKATLNGETVQIVNAEFRDAPGRATRGPIAMAITPTGELRRLVQKEKIIIAEVKSGEIEITTAYDVNLKLDAPIVGNPFVVQ
ncbi:hypothetical protein BH11ARM2_BH11ARM2_34730 [soil metagenome]